MKIKTSELTGPALDWAVASIDKAGISSFDTDKGTLLNTAGNQYSPSTSWAQGGPIIERCQLEISHDYNDDWVAAYSHPYLSDPVKAYFKQHGPTPLIAAMRCYVASKLGEEVDVPDELTTA